MARVSKLHQDNNKKDNRRGDGLVARRLFRMCEFNQHLETKMKNNDLKHRNEKVNKIYDDS